MSGIAGSRLYMNDSAINRRRSNPVKSPFRLADSGRINSVLSLGMDNGKRSRRLFSSVDNIPATFVNGTAAGRVGSCKTLLQIVVMERKRERKKEERLDIHISERERERW